MNRFVEQPDNSVRSSAAALTATTNKYPNEVALALAEAVAKKFPSKDYEGILDAAYIMFSTPGYSAE